MDPNKNQFEPDELPPKAAWLMSYLDGELCPEEAARVESWIGEDPEAHHQHEEERRRRALFAAAAIPEPAPPAWDATFARLESALLTPKTQAAPRRAARLWVVVGIAAAAAVAALWIRSTGLFQTPTPIEPPGPVEVLQVASGDDIVIEQMDPNDVSQLAVRLTDDLWTMRTFQVSAVTEIAVESMNGDDTDRLVIGEPPVMGRLVMAQPHEVQDLSVRMSDKRQPEPRLVQTGGVGGMPMLNVSLKKD